MVNVNDALGPASPMLTSTPFQQANRYPRSPRFTTRLAPWAPTHATSHHSSDTPVRAEHGFPPRSRRSQYRPASRSSPPSSVASSPCPRSQQRREAQRGAVTAVTTASALANWYCEERAWRSIDDLQHQHQQFWKTQIPHMIAAPVPRSLHRQTIRQLGQTSGSESFPRSL